MKKTIIIFLVIAFAFNANIVFAQNNYMSCTVINDEHSLAIVFKDLNYYFYITSMIDNTHGLYDLLSVGTYTLISDTLILNDSLFMFKNRFLFRDYTLFPLETFPFLMNQEIWFKDFDTSDVTFSGIFYTKLMRDFKQSINNFSDSIIANNLSNYHSQLKPGIYKNSLFGEIILQDDLSYIINYDTLKISVGKWEQKNNIIILKDDLTNLAIRLLINSSDCLIGYIPPYPDIIREYKKD